MENGTQLYHVTEGNLRNSHLYLGGDFDFFPKDCIGASKRAANGNGRGVPVTIQLELSNAVVTI